MDLLKIMIPTILVIVSLFLIRYDRNKVVKKRHIEWVSIHIFRDKTGLNASAERLLQTLLSFAFIFYVGIAGLFIISLFE